MQLKNFYLNLSIFFSKKTHLCYKIEMKILRKRVGSLKIRDEDKSNIKISNDSILLNQEILFRFLIPTF